MTAHSTTSPTAFYQDLQARGLVKQVTSPDLEKELARGPLTLYCGFDPTADALHVGSLLPLMTLKRFQLAGHRPIAVVGGATGMIGDPSGKSQERSLMDDDRINHNLAGIRRDIAKVLETAGPRAATVVNNADWFKGFSYIAFLRDVGKHFTVNHMMSKDSVRARLEDREHGISYTEFSYMLLQAYDFYHLHKHEGCRLQVGGSDQWGNITEGTELIRRMAAAHGEPAPEVFGLTHPLVSKSDGTKFGKTEQGAVWLDPKKTSPYRFYQFFVQTPDADALTYLHYFTFLPAGEMAAFEAALKSAPEKREAQLRLAREVTRLIHGEGELARAEKATQALFGESIRELDEPTLLDVLEGAPKARKDKASLGGLALLDLLVETGLCPSKGQARKDVQAGGVYLNNERVSDPALALSASHLIAGAHLVLRKGKKNYYLVSFA